MPKDVNFDFYASCFRNVRFDSNFQNNRFRLRGVIFPSAILESRKENKKSDILIGLCNKHLYLHTRHVLCVFLKQFVLFLYGEPVKIAKGLHKNK